MSKTQWIKDHAIFFHAAVSVILIAIIMGRLDLRSQLDAFMNFKMRYFLYAIIIEFVLGYFYCYKWYLILKKIKIKTSSIALFLINHISAFYALVVPSRLTQEAVKMYKVSRGRSKKITYLSSILLDKATGAIGLFLCGFLGLFLSGAEFLSDDIKLFSLGLILLILISIFLFLYLPVEKLFNLFGFSRLNEIRDSCIEMKEEKAFFAGICLYSIALHMALATIYWPLIIGSGFHVSIINLIWIYNLVSFLLILPISVSGFGVRESVLIFILGKYGFSAEQAVDLSLLTVFSKFLQGVFFGLPLDLFWIKRYYRRPVEHDH